MSCAAHSATLYQILYPSIYLSISHIFRNTVIFAQTITGLSASVRCTSESELQIYVLKDSQANVTSVT